MLLQQRPLAAECRAGLRNRHLPPREEEKSGTPGTGRSWWVTTVWRVQFSYAPRGVLPLAAPIRPGPENGRGPGRVDGGGLSVNIHRRHPIRPGLPEDSIHGTRKVQQRRMPRPPRATNRRGGAGSRWAGPSDPLRLQGCWRPPGRLGRGYPGGHRKGTLRLCKGGRGAGCPPLEETERRIRETSGYIDAAVRLANAETL